MCFPSGLSNPCAVQVLLSRNSEFAEPPATVQSSKKMVYQVFDTFRPSVSAVSCFASGFHAKMRYSLETESSRSHRRRCRVRKKWCIKCLTFSGPFVSAMSWQSNPYIYTKRLCRACQPYRVKRAVQPLCFAGLSQPLFLHKANVPGLPTLSREKGCATLLLCRALQP